MSDFTKIIRIGTHERKNIYAKISYNDGRLSIRGVIAPRNNGNASSCGQIEMSMDAQFCEYIKLAPRWTAAMLTQFLCIWRKWHLNDTQAGTPAQMAELEKHKFPGYPMLHYDWAKETLTKAGLEPDNGYSYGSAWLRVDVPDEALDFLRALPDTDKKPAWI